MRIWFYNFLCRYNYFLFFTVFKFSHHSDLSSNSCDRKYSASRPFDVSWSIFVPPTNAIDSRVCTHIPFPFFMQLSLIPHLNCHLWLFDLFSTYIHPFAVLVIWPSIKYLYDIRVSLLLHASIAQIIACLAWFDFLTQVIPDGWPMKAL